MSSSTEVNLGDFLGKKAKMVILKQRGISDALKEIDEEMDAENEFRYRIRTIEHAGRIERDVVGRDGSHVEDLPADVLEKQNESIIHKKLIKRNINPDLVDALLS